MNIQPVENSAANHPEEAVTTIGEDGLKIVLSGHRLTDIWGLIGRHYAGDDPVKWKHLAMLALRENAGWPMERIGRTFDYSRGHVARALLQLERELRERFEREPGSGER